MFGRAGSAHRRDGVDFSERAVAAARESFRDRQLDARFIEGDFQNLTLRDRFDVIYFSRFAYAFIAGRTRRIELLRGLADKRSARGLIVISFGLVQDRSWEHARPF